MSTSRGQQYPASPRPACQGPAATLHPGCPPVLPIRTASLASSAGIAGTGEDSVAGWDAGIRAPNYAQRACPQGTVAEPAIANPNAIRCVAR